MRHSTLHCLRIALCLCIGLAFCNPFSRKLDELQRQVKAHEREFQAVGYVSSVSVEMYFPARNTNPIIDD